MFRGAALDIKFSNRGAAKIYDHTVLDTFQANVLSDQSTAHEIASAVEADAAVFANQTDLLRVRVIPRRRIALERAWAGLPVRGRDIHLQRFVRTDMVMLLAMRIQPYLPAL